MTTPLQNLRQTDKIVNPDGSPTDYFMRLIQARGGIVTDIETSVANIQAVDIVAGTALSGGGNISGPSDVTLNHANSAVTPGSYTSANITVDQQGHVTAAANGSGGAGAWEFVETLSPSSATTISSEAFAGLGYAQIKFVLRLSFGTDAVQPSVQYKQNGSYLSGASDYRWVARAWNTGGSTNIGTDTTDSSIKLTNSGTWSVGNSSGEFFTGEFTVDYPDSTDFRKYLRGNFAYILSSDGTEGNALPSGAYQGSNDATALTGVRFGVSSGNFTGTIKVYGLKGS